MFLSRSALAGDGAALQVGVARHIDVEPASSGCDARLPGGALVVVVDLLPAGAHAAGDRRTDAKRRHAHADGKAAAGLLALVLARVLQGFDVQVAADVHLDGAAGDLRALQVGVGAALDFQVAGCGDLGVVIGRFAAVRIALALAGAGLEAQAVLGAAEGQGGAEAGAAAAVGALELRGVLRGLQVDVACRVQADVLRLKLGAGRSDVGVPRRDVDASAPGCWCRGCWCWTAWRPACSSWR